MASEWIIIALIAAVLYGVAQVVGKYVIDKLSAPMMVSINFVVTMPIYIVFLAAFIRGLGPWLTSIEPVIYGLIAALLGRAGYYLYLEAVERGPVTIVGSITAAYPAIITVLAITLLHEDITWLQGIGIAVIVGGMVGISLSHDESSSRTLSRSSLILSLLTLAVWGVWGVFVKLALDTLPIIYYLGLYALVLPPLYFVYERHKKASGVKMLPKWSQPVMIAVVAAVIGQIGLLADTTAVSLGEAAIAFPLIASYPVIMILLAYVFLKERLSRRDLLMVAAVVAGILMVSTV
jgi:bacterial/archaeal transporter family protein